jgi:hypothetical protein
VTIRTWFDFEQRLSARRRVDRLRSVDCDTRHHESNYDNIADGGRITACRRNEVVPIDLQAAACKGPPHFILPFGAPLDLMCNMSLVGQ